MGVHGATGTMTQSSYETAPSVRKRMQRTRGKDNSFEQNIRTRLYAIGLRYRVNYSLPNLKRRSCDIAFPRLKIAIFLDGCFWHGCPEHSTIVRKNPEFWLSKINRNRERDVETREVLAQFGWTVLRFWEHQVADDIVDAIVSTVTHARGF
ncbi:very short patch repair endonuclease [Rhizobium sp. N4311]|uniref:very short patch repair endonuclease n=1 Tax=Rhizobium sp. N4311 TaxID=1703972 RepID=UPI0032AE833C